MVDVTLRIDSLEGIRQVPLVGDRLSIGRGDVADLVINDFGLSRLHSSICREDSKVWVIDEGSTNGTFVNRKQVPPVGMPLSDGDEIRIGDQTRIRVSIRVAETLQQNSSQEKMGSGLQLIAIAAISAAILIITAVLTSNYFREQKDDRRVEKIDPQDGEDVQQDNDLQKDEKEKVEKIEEEKKSTDLEKEKIVPRKLYLQMNETEKMEFIDREAQHISMMMGNRSYVFNDDVLQYIKKYVDGYASRAGSSSDRLWGEGLRSLYGRATRFAPYIIRSFNGRGVPPTVGLYIVMIETEYHECLESPVGAKGLFQFMPETARGYGVDPADRCDAKKMAPAAAEYMADRIAEFGPDAMSVALAIAGYNRSPDSVRRDLHDVLNSENKERSFWTLVANSTKLDRPFQNENIKYVPKFFAAAIVGENPWAFGLQINPLSTYTEQVDSRLASIK
jgi:pSer/pThr/pTyr-binding forkhead associated (FHA) protein